MDIVSLPIEEDGSIDSRFRLVEIASQRARELAYGAKPKIQTKFKKAPTVALEESIEHKLDFLVGEEARVANEEAKKFDYKRFLEERKREEMPEDITDLEKDLKVYLTEKEDTGRQMLEDLFSDKDGEENKKS